MDLTYKNELKHHLVKQRLSMYGNTPNSEICGCKCNSLEYEFLHFKNAKLI